MSKKTKNEWFNAQKTWNEAVADFQPLSPRSKPSYMYIGLSRWIIWFVLTLGVQLITKYPHGEWVNYYKTMTFWQINFDSKKTFWLRSLENNLQTSATVDHLTQYLLSALVNFPLCFADVLKCVNFNRYTFVPFPMVFMTD